MYSIFAWLDLHKLSSIKVQAIILAYQARMLETSSFHALSQKTLSESSPESGQVSNELHSQYDCYRNIVVPALVAAFPNETNIENILCCKVEFSDPGSGEQIPHTINQGMYKPAVISLNWQGRVEDLMCLAHEAAHALQNNLSGNNIMPPVAREACAFLGELLLLDYIKNSTSSLYLALLDVWNTENTFYFDECFEVLTDAINYPKSPYHYFQNYPIARLAAMQIFLHAQRGFLLTLFSSGENAMAYLPIDSLSDRAKAIKNNLLPMPQSDSESPAINVYRGLGAMVLLDIENWKAETEKPINEYYATLLNHMQDQTVFVGLNKDHRPLGYATWEYLDTPGVIRLTRQITPFGDRFELQHMLMQHISGPVGVDACYKRNGLEAQLVW